MNLGEMSLRVLLVEDAPSDAALVKAQLRHSRTPVDVDWVDSIEKALDMVRSRGYECILLDLHLPDATGVEGVRTLARAAPAVPLVVLTGLDERTVAYEALASGAQDYLVKGRVEGDELLLRLSHAIVRRHSVFEREQRLERDPLTNLPQRRLLEEHTAGAIEQSMRRGERLAICYFDLDGFKPLNDQYGHAFGDLILREVANVLRTEARASDIVGRVGGDEFVVLQSPVAGPDEAIRATRRIVEAIRAIHNVSGRSVAIGVSAGVALFPDDGHTFTQLMAAADQAMYDAKRDGGSHVHAHVTHRLGMDRVFDPQRWDAALVFQPWMDVATDRCGGVEALLRRREGAILQDPEMLLECARRTGSQSDVVAWVMGQACRQLADWRANGLDVPRVSVNVTAADATGPVFPKLVMSLLDEHGVAPSDLQIEIDERTIGHPEPGLLQNLAELRTAGVHIFLDRFGGNGASLKRLSSMPINGVKIDRDVTRDSDRKENAAMIAGGVAASKVLGLDIIVVGIENAAQTVRWKGGSSQFQGYHYCAPLPAALIEPTLRQGCPQPVRPSADDED